MDYLQIIGIITGGGATGFIVAIATMRSQYFQQKGIAKQELAKGTNEEANALINIDNIYEKMTIQVNKEFDKMQKKIDILEDKLNKYIDQCTVCPNNKIK